MSEDFFNIQQQLLGKLSDALDVPLDEQNYSANSTDPEAQKFNNNRAAGKQNEE